MFVIYFHVHVPPGESDDIKRDESRDWDATSARARLRRVRRSKRLTSSNVYDNKPIFFSGARIPVHLQAATTATTLSTSRVRRGRGHVLDAANLQAATGKRAKRGLTTRTRALRLVTTRRAHLNVKRGDTEFLASRRDVLRRKHRRVRGRFIAISLHLHTAGAAAEGFLARQIRDVLWRGRKFKVLSVATFVCLSSARSKSRTQLFPSISRAMVPPCRDERRPSTPHHRHPTHRTAPRAFHPRPIPRRRRRRRITRDELKKRNTHHESIVKRRVNVRDTEDEFAFARVRTDVLRLRIPMKKTLTRLVGCTDPILSHTVSSARSIDHTHRQRIERKRMREILFASVASSGSVAYHLYKLLRR